MSTISRADIREGDKITATHADGSAVTAAVKKQTSGDTLYLEPLGVTHYDVSLSLPNLAEKGYTFRLVSRPRPVFAPGIYRDRDGDLRFRAPGGGWHLLTAYGVVAAEIANLTPGYDSDDDLSDSLARDLTFITPAYQKPGA